MVKPAAIALFLAAPVVLNALPPSRQREDNPVAAFDVASIKRSNTQATARYSREIDTTDDLPSIFVALPEQLGLRLVPGRSLLRAVIVDRIERPTEH
jgi:hypothetical protein